MSQDAKGNFVPGRYPSTETTKIKVDSGSSGDISIPFGATACILTSSIGVDVDFGWAAQAASTTTASVADGGLTSGGVVYIPLPSNFYKGKIYYHAYSDVYLNFSFYGSD